MCLVSIIEDIHEQIQRVECKTNLDEHVMSSTKRNENKIQHVECKMNLHVISRGYTI